MIIEINLSNSIKNMESQSLESESSSGSQNLGDTNK